MRRRITKKENTVLKIKNYKVKFKEYNTIAIRKVSTVIQILTQIQILILKK